MPLTEVLAGETPGASLIIWRKSRPFIGRSATVLVSTTPTSAVEVVSMRGGGGGHFDDLLLLRDAESDIEVGGLGDGDFHAVELSAIQSRGG